MATQRPQRRSAVSSTQPLSRCHSTACGKAHTPASHQSLRGNRAPAIFPLRHLAASRACKGSGTGTLAPARQVGDYPRTRPTIVPRGRQGLGCRCSVAGPQSQLYGITWVAAAKARHLFEVAERGDRQSTPTLIRALARNPSGFHLQQAREYLETCSCLQFQSRYKAAASNPFGDWPRLPGVCLGLFLF